MSPQLTLVVRVASLATPSLTNQTAQTTPTQTFNIFSNSSSDIEARSTIVFGVFGTFFAAIGLILTAMTLRTMYRTHRARNRLERSQPVDDAVEIPEMENQGTADRRGSEGIDRHATSTDVPNEQRQ